MFAKHSLTFALPKVFTFTLPKWVNNDPQNKPTPYTTEMGRL